MRRKSFHGNSARSSIASAAGATSASTNRATARRNSSCSAVNWIMVSRAAGPAPSVGGPRRGAPRLRSVFRYSFHRPSIERRGAGTFGGVACWRSGAAPLRTHCAAQLGRGALVHLEVEPVVLDHHPIVRARRLDRHVVVQDVLEHPPRVALERIAVPARAGLLERHDIAVGKL